MIELLMTLFFDNPAWRDRLADRKLGITIPDDLPDDDELRETYRTARSLDPEILAYFESQDLSVTPSEIEQGITEILNRFEVNILKVLQSDLQKWQPSSDKKAKNIFEFAGCEKLYLSNKYTRIISESLGHQFEEIAALSPRVLIPETSLGLKLKGIDAIVYVDAEIYYTQIKTKRDTLTGSQVSHSF